MTNSGALDTSRPMLELLIRVKARSVFNRVRKAVDEAPLRVFFTVLLIALIWLGLYGLFRIVCTQLEHSPLEATVAIPLIFNFFFVALLTLLTFSNAIIAYGALFGQSESAYLLTSPISPLDLVTFKFFESLLTASWSLVLLGMPLMLAMADLADNGWFNLLFVAFFLAFLPIPSALGLLVAWAAARFVKRQARRALAIVLGTTAAVCAAWGLRALQKDTTPPEEWLGRFYEQMSFFESAFMPNHWVAQGIDHALSGHFNESLLYLSVTASSAFFLSWLIVRAVAKRLDTAFDCASVSCGVVARSAVQASGGVAGWVFAYLPRELRLIAAKDLRTFFRDPLQWTQLAILFGLLALYLTNMPTLQSRILGWGWTNMIPFLNLCALSLILATFTCRFVFPLVSLEGRQLWLVGLLPMPRGRILHAKFAFAMTVTMAVALSAMTLALVMLKLEVIWAVIHLAVVIAICVGLCGFSVGIGARLPMFHERNPARIANGLGGTVNLLASVTLVTVVLTGVGIATWWSRESAFPTSQSVGLCAASVLLCVAAGLKALSRGARHFDRLEV